MESLEEAEAGKAPASPTLPSFKGRLITTDSDCDSDKDLWVGCDRCKACQMPPPPHNQRAAPEPGRSLPPDRGVEGRSQAQVCAGAGRGSGRAAEPQAGLAKEQRRLVTRLNELQAAAD